MGLDDYLSHEVSSYYGGDVSAVLSEAGLVSIDPEAEYILYLKSLDNGDLGSEFDLTIDVIYDDYLDTKQRADALFNYAQEKLDSDEWVSLSTIGFSDSTRGETTFIKADFEKARGDAISLCQNVIDDIDYELENGDFPHEECGIDSYDAAMKLAGTEDRMLPSAVRQDMTDLIKNLEDL